MKSFSVIALAALTLAQVVSASFKPLTITQRNLAYQITSTWENENYDHSTQSWTLAFNYCQNIDDGQGITIGFTGFTSNGGDALNMIQSYKRINPRNAFHKMSSIGSCLKSVQNKAAVSCFKCKDSSCSRSTLCDAAKVAYAKDRKNYIKAQTDQDHNDNWSTSQALAKKYNILLPLSQAFLYDSCVNHACDFSGNDVEGIIVKHALKRHSKKVGSSTKAQQQFYMAMLETRRKYMCGSGCDCCPDSKWRIPGFKWLADQGYWHLPNPMKIRTFQDSPPNEFTFKCNPKQFPFCNGSHKRSLNSTE